MSLPSPFDQLYHSISSLSGKVIFLVGTPDSGHIELALQIADRERLVKQRSALFLTLAYWGTKLRVLREIPDRDTGDLISEFSDRLDLYRHYEALLDVLHAEASGMIVFDERRLFTTISRRWNEETDREWAVLHQNTSNLARKLNVPVVVLLEVSSAEKLTLAGVRRFGAADMYADVIWLMKNTGESESELVIGKNREGPLGEFRLRWSSDLAKYI